MSGTLDTNAIFLLALTTTVIVQTVNGSIFLVDSLILVQLGFGFVFGVMSLWGYRTRYYKSRYPGAAADDKGKYHFGGWGTHCRLARFIEICLEIPVSDLDEYMRIYPPSARVGS